jgi:hypothetical protein
LTGNVSDSDCSTASLKCKASKSTTDSKKPSNSKPNKPEHSFAQKPQSKITGVKAKEYGDGRQSTLSLSTEAGRWLEQIQRVEMK